MGPEQTPLEVAIASNRASLGECEMTLLSLKATLRDSPEQYPIGETEDRNEVHANLQLAIRHVEDAKMRLGKVFQAINGGVSNNTR